MDPVEVVVLQGCMEANDRQNLRRANYSNRGWREKIFENMFFEAERRGKLFQMKVLGAAIDSDKFSSKSELSSRFFGRLKFSALFE